MAMPDRMSAERSSPRPIFLTAEWRKLVMANYAVVPELLRPFVPHGTELDLFAGTCYVSLVGFLFTNTRLKGITIPFHTTFEEVNLRSYVRHRGPDGWRRGVVFVREFVPKSALTFVARTIYGEPYATVPMGHAWSMENGSLTVRYRWKKQRWHHIAVEAAATPMDAAPGSEAEFITEHCWGYTRRGPQRTLEYGLEHPRWPVCPVLRHQVDVDFGLLYGERFGVLNGQPPASVLLAEGSSIVVRGARRCV